MVYLQVILMAILQGLTEFLPVSSSGHLVLLNELFIRFGWGGFEEPLMLSVLLHCASLLAIICYYWRPLWRMALGKDPYLLRLLIVGTIPIGIVGGIVKIFFDAPFKAMMSNIQITGLMMLLTAVLLLCAQKLSTRNPHELQKLGLRWNLKTLSWKRALAIGCAQALAVLPGLSRSGTTITAGLFAGLKRQDAGTFSFLLAIPAVGAASLGEILKLLKDGSAGNVGILPLGIGFIICFIVSLFALALLVRLLRSRSIGIFSFYLIPLGVILLLL